MSYTITFEPLSKKHGMTPRTIVLETATDAWKLVRSLEKSDEWWSINGGSVDWDELEILAKQEAD